MNEIKNDKFSALAESMRALDGLTQDDTQWVLTNLRMTKGSTSSRITVAPRDDTSFPTRDKYRAAINEDRPLWQNCMLAIAYLAQKPDDFFRAGKINDVLFGPRGERNTNITNAIRPARENSLIEDVSSEKGKWAFYKLTDRGWDMVRNFIER